MNSYIDSGCSKTYGADLSVTSYGAYMHVIVPYERMDGCGSGAMRNKSYLLAPHNTLRPPSTLTRHPHHFSPLLLPYLICIIVTSPLMMVPTYRSHVTMSPS